MFQFTAIDTPVLVPFAERNGLNYEKHRHYHYTGKISNIEPVRGKIREIYHTSNYIAGEFS